MASPSSVLTTPEMDPVLLDDGVGGAARARAGVSKTQIPTATSEELASR